MRLSNDEVKKRKAKVAEILAADPNLTDKAVIEKMKKSTGKGVGSRLVREVRDAKHDKAHAKFTDGKSRPLNGAAGHQIPVVAKPVVTKKAPIAVSKPPTPKAVTTLSVDQATELLKPALRNIQKIMEACASIQIIGMKREGSKIVQFGQRAKTEIAPLVVEL